MDAFERLVQSLVRARVRFVVIGLSGANYYARSGHELFVTQDRDLFIPRDTRNVLAAWSACEAVGLELFIGREPLDHPRDLVLAERVIANRALVRASDAAGLDVDLALEMAGFEFDAVWPERRVFRVGHAKVPVARLSHIVESKRLAGRDKDRLFLATHAETIRDLVDADGREPSKGSRRRSSRPSRRQ
jgi:hypothetical protein